MKFSSGLWANVKVTVFNRKKMASQGTMKRGSFGSPVEILGKEK